MNVDFPTAIESTPPLDPTPFRISLEVMHGRTRYPHRPVQRPRFLIGGDAACDLRLGGPEMPPLHSLILVTPDAVRIEPIVASPSLIVNDSQTTGCTLADGDRIRIGGVELIARVQRSQPAANVAEAAPASAPVSDLITSADDVHETVVDLSTLSAEELVDLLASDMKQVEEFDAVHRAGLQSLLQAAMTFAPDDTAATLMSGPHGRDAALTSDDVQHLATALSELATELSRRTAHDAVRDQQITAAADLLAEAQERLAVQLETLVGHVAELRERQQQTQTPLPRLRRATA